MSTITELKTNHNTVIRTETAPGGITPDDVADQLDNMADEVRDRGILYAATTTALQALSGANSKFAIVANTGLFQHLSSGSANGIDTFSATGGGVWYLIMRASVDSFTPSQVASLAMWYDISDAASITQSGGVISKISDKSGNARHLEATHTAFPTYSATGGGNDKAYINISPTKDIYINGLSIPQPYVVYLVVKQKTFVDNKNIFVLNMSNNQSGIAHKTISGKNKTVPWYNGVGLMDVNSDAYKNKFMLLSTKWNGANSTFRINNEQIGFPFAARAGGTQAISAFGLGYYSFTSDCDIQEVLVYAADVSAMDDLKIRSYLTLKYSLLPTPYITCFGDSITQGYNSTDRQYNSWAALVASEMGYNLCNNGITSTTVYDFHATVHGVPGQNLIDIYSRAFEGPHLGEWVIFGYGQNDKSGSPGTTWKNQYKAIVQEFINKGYSPSKIIIHTPPVGTADANATAMNVYIAQIASELGTKYFDFSAYFVANGGMSWMADGLHPNDTGHRQIADKIKLLMV